MLIGLSGSLITHHFAERILPEEFAGRLGEASLGAAHQSLARWWHAECSQLGPASSVRAVWDTAAAPLAEHLGFTVETSRGEGHDTRHAILQCGTSRLVLFATTWNTSLDNLWREAVRSGIGLDAPWVFCTNGHQWRLIDTVRTYSRAYVHFDLRQTIEHPATFGLFWGLLRAEAFRPTDAGPPLVVQVIQSSARHGHAVGRSLRFGVIEAVQCLLGALNKCGRHNLNHLLDESLTIVYRLLFLMFAESSGPGAKLAPSLSRKLHGRIAARPRGAQRTRTRPVGNAPGHCPTCAQGVPRREARRAAVQRPPVLTSTLSHRRDVCSGRRIRAPGAAGIVVDRVGSSAPREGGRSSRHDTRGTHGATDANRLSRPWCRTAWRGL